MSIDRVEAFRDEAVEEGWIAENPYSFLGRCFLLDLTQGSFYTSATPTAIGNVVKLARKHAKKDSYGEHNELLQLVATQSDLANQDKVVCWHQPNFNIQKYPGVYITLKEWLERNGQNVAELIS